MKTYDAIEQAYKNGFNDGVISIVKHGRWTLICTLDKEFIGWTHEECGRITREAYKYCPECGAKMSLE